MDIIIDLAIPLMQSQRIKVKMLVEQCKPTPENKKLLESSIAKMHLVSILNEQTIRIRGFKDENFSYQAIYVIGISLKEVNNLNTLAHLIHSAFPEPTFLIFFYKDKTYISLASKRINKIETDKTVVEDVISTEISAKANNEQKCIATIKGANLKEYYTNLITWLYKLKVLNITGIYPSKELDFKSILKEYDSINAKLNRLKEEYKSASMTSDKMRIDDDIYECENDITSLILKLKK